MRQLRQFIVGSKLDADLGIRLAAAVAFVVAALDLFGLWDNLPFKAVSFITLFLLASLVLYSVKEKGEILAEKESLRQIVESQGTIEYVSTEHELFRGSIYKLEHTEFDKIRIFAPVALWKKSKHKEDWLKALAKATTPANPDQEPWLEELCVIYGLPPEKQTFLDVTRPSLELLSGKKPALIQYLPPEFSRLMPLPGWGLIIMGDQLVGIAFATRGHQTLVDSAILTTKRQVVNMAIKWFDQIWTETHLQSIQDVRRGIEMKPQLDEIEQYYSNRSGSQP